MHVLVVIDLTGAQKLPANTNTAILRGAMRDKRRAELDQKRRAELDHNRATSLVALKAGVPTTDVAERQIDVAERQIDEAERQIDVAGVFICGNHSSTQYPTCAMRRCAAPQS